MPDFNSSALADQSAASAIVSAGGVKVWIDPAKHSSRNNVSTYSFSSDSNVPLFATGCESISSLNEQFFAHRPGLSSGTTFGSDRFQFKTTNFELNGFCPARGFFFAPIASGTGRISLNPNEFFCSTVIGINAQTAASKIWLSSEAPVSAASSALNNSTNYAPDNWFSTPGVGVSFIGGRQFEISINDALGRSTSASGNRIVTPQLTAPSDVFVLSIKMARTNNICSIIVSADGVRLCEISVSASNGNSSASIVDGPILFENLAFDPIPRAVTSFGSPTGRNEVLNEVAFGEHVIFSQVPTTQSESSIVQSLKSKWAKVEKPFVIDKVYRRIAVANNQFETVIRASDASGDTSVSAIGIPVGWTIEKNPYDSRFFKVSTTSPIPETKGFFMRVVGEGAGATSASLLRILVATSGQLDYEQKLIFFGPQHVSSSLSELMAVENPPIDSVKVWLDPSDDQSVVVGADQTSIVGLKDRYSGTEWLVSSSETVTREISLFAKKGIAFSDVYYSTGFNTTIRLSDTSLQEFSRRYLQSDQFVPTASSGIPVSSLGSMTSIMVLGYNAPPLGEAEGSFYQMPSNSLTSINGVPLNGVPPTDFGGMGIYVKQTGQSTGKLVIRSSRISEFLTAVQDQRPYDASGSFVNGRIETADVFQIGASSVVSFVFDAETGANIRVNSVPQALRLKGEYVSENDYLVTTSVLGLFEPGSPLVNKVLPTQLATNRMVGTPQNVLIPRVASRSDNLGSALVFGYSENNFLTYSGSAVAWGQKWAVDFRATLQNSLISESEFLTICRIGETAGVYLRYSSTNDGRKLQLVNGDPSISSNIYELPGHNLTTHINQEIHFRIQFSGGQAAGNTLQLYINGALTLTVPNVTRSLPSFLYIGGLPSAGTGYMGQIRQLRVQLGEFDAPIVRDIAYTADPTIRTSVDLPVSAQNLQRYFTPPTTVGSYSAPGGYVFGAVGQLACLDDAISSSHLTAIEQYLASNWLGAGTSAPDIGEASSMVSVLGEEFQTSIRIDSLYPQDVAAYIGGYDQGNWSISQDQADPLYWNVRATGLTTIGDHQFTVAATEAGFTSTKLFSYSVLEVPKTPKIVSFDPTYGAPGANYQGFLMVEDLAQNQFRQIDVTASAGSGWEVVPGNNPKKFLIRGKFPNQTTNFQVQVTVRSYSSDGQRYSAETKTFAFRTLSISSEIYDGMPLDRSGTLSSNKIQNEKHSVTLLNGQDRQMVVPVFAPFFGDSLKVTFKGPLGEDRIATIHKDFEPVFEVTDVEEAVDGPIFCAIALLNDAIDREVSLSYQSVGSELTVDRHEVYTKLTERILSPRRINWTSITGAPEFMPVAPHAHDVSTDVVGFSYLTSSALNIRNQIAVSGYGEDIAEMQAHIGSNGSSHSPTKAQIGLPNVPNFPRATTSQATDPQNTSTLLTPSSASAAAKANLSNATVTVSGISQLNLGLEPGDATNSTDALTPKGLLNLLTSSTANVIKDALSAGQVVGKVTPFPIAFPKYWRGERHVTISTLITAVRNHVGISNLTYNHNTGAFYFPVGVTVPDLTLRDTIPNPKTEPYTTGEFTTNLSTGYIRSATGETEQVLRRFSVADPVTTPLSISETIVY